jgi:cytochrome c peroxidase
MHRRALHYVVLISVAGASEACADSARGPDADATLADAVDAPSYLPLAPFPSAQDAATITPARVELGRQLFHDPIFSSDHRVACVTCHGEIWGLSDALQFSIGVGGIGAPGPGRTGPTHTRRNASTIWNAAWRASLFWDGRARSLEDQVHFPIEATYELNRTPDAIVADLRTFPAYAPLFAAAFPDDADPITVANMEVAIASFERTLVSNNAPFDEWARGDRGAMDPDEIQGWQLFNEVRCVDCHAPPLFESERYESTAAPPVTGIDDQGRYEFTHVDADQGHYRVPTLRNLRVTAPYFHNGTVTSIESAISLEVAAGHSSRALAVWEIGAIATFLRVSLMDITRVPDRPRVAPSGLPVPTDNLEIVRDPMRDGGL